MDKLTMSTTITSYGGWELSCNYDWEDRKYYGVRIIPPQGTPWEGEVWDGEYWLYNYFYEFISGTFGDHHRHVDDEIIKYFMNWPSEVDEVKQLLNRGKQLGWHKL